MKQFAVVSLVTAMGFAAGVFAGMSLERHRPLPPPPVGFGSEFHHMQGGPPWRKERPMTREELIAQIQAIRPELEQFQTRLDGIQAEFTGNFDALLNPGQRAAHAAEIKRRASRLESGKGPLSDEQISRILWGDASRTVLWDVVIPLPLDALTRMYKLDDQQREQTRVLLQKRRSEFLALVDSSPPPSVSLSRLAPMVQRLAPSDH